jgi:hypothetical protein
MQKIRGSMMTEKIRRFMSFGLLKRCILLLLMILVMGGPTLGGILISCTRRNQPDLRRYLEMHQFGCYSSVRRSGIRIRSAGHICRTIMGRGRGQGREAMASASIGYDGCGRSSLHCSRGVRK